MLVCYILVVKRKCYSYIDMHCCSLAPLAVHYKVKCIVLYMIFCQAAVSNKISNILICFYSFDLFIFLS